MGKLVVSGCNELKGTVRASGSKNAVLPIIAGAILSDEECLLEDIPKLSDVSNSLTLLQSLGIETAWLDNDQANYNVLKLNAQSINNFEASYDQVRKMRASILIMGPLLARLGRAKMSMPGGCPIGTRPINLHLKGFEALGARIEIGHGYVEAIANKLKGNKIYLDFPSVGATENIMMAATMAEGTTVIENAAEEPEIVDLANFLNAMGANVSGAGTKIIKIRGVDRLHGTSHTIIPDRIEIGTYMVGTAMIGGKVYIQNVITDHLKPMIAKLIEAGVKITEDDCGILVEGSGEIRPIDIKTLPYPGFPTDMQPQFMALLSVANGTSIVTETIFENRFMHADELTRMGANIKIEGSTAVVEGVKELTGTQVRATDLRAGASLLLAALKAKGDTEIGSIHHIERGYEKIEDKLIGLGANIRKIDTQDNDLEDELASCD
jgi:UDP-N-acetylglucosamine 1-carboxyvinyltransferase